MCRHSHTRGKRFFSLNAEWLTLNARPRRPSRAPLQATRLNLSIKIGQVSSGHSARSPRHLRDIERGVIECDARRQHRRKDGM
jgi:hypothetical protein